MRSFYLLTVCFSIFGQQGNSWKCCSKFFGEIDWKESVEVATQAVEKVKIECCDKNEGEDRNAAAPAVKISEMVQ